MPIQEENLDAQRLIIEYTTIFLRRKRWFFIAFIGGILLSALLILFLPKSYQSTTMILVEGQKIPEEFVRSTVSDPIEERLSTIRQQILSRAFLQQIIDQFSLYKNITETEEDKIVRMRKDIEIKTLGHDHINAFSVSFIGKTPMIAMEVTTELASRFIKENLKIREQLVEGTTDFIDSELENLKRKLEEQEGSISQFKRAHSGQLPGQMDANLRTLDRLQLSLQSSKMDMKAAERIDPLYQTWQSEKQKLGELQRKYSDNHPDVLALRKEVKELDARILARDGKGPSRREMAEMPLEFQDKISNSAELLDLKDRVKKTEDQIRDYENRIENIPQREQQLAVLIRDYDNTKKNYETLLDKKLSAKISENLEKRQKGEQFRVLDAANFPERPYKPNPIKIGFLGTILGLIVGVGLVFVREMSDSSIRNPEDLEKLSSIPVLASILDYENFPRPPQVPRDSKFGKLAHKEDAYVKK